MPRSTLSGCGVILLAGCFPAVSVEEPGVSGRVVDYNGQPASAAQLVLRSKYNDCMVATTRTGAARQFHEFAGDERWFIYFLPQDNPAPPVFGVEITSGAASFKAADVTGGQLKPFGLGHTDTVDVGTVLFQK